MARRARASIPTPPPEPTKLAAAPVGAAPGPRVGSVREVKLAHGAYVPAAAEWSPNRDLLAVAKRAPGTVFCLFSALQLHRIANPDRRIFVLVGRNGRRPELPGVTIEAVWGAADHLELGLEPLLVDHVRLTVTNLARTVVDCFRLHRRVGLDVAVLTLQAARRREQVSSDALWYYAQKLGVASLMRPYLECVR